MLYESLLDFPHADFRPKKLGRRIKLCIEVSHQVDGPLVGTVPHFVLKMGNLLQIPHMGQVNTVFTVLHNGRVAFGRQSLKFNNKCWGF